VFQRTERISRKEFPSTLASGRRASTPHFTLVVPEGVSGYAVVVSKKVARLSVHRHKIKRRVLAALRALTTEGSPLPKALIVFPKGPVASMTYKGVKEEIVVLLSKFRN